MVKKDNVKQKHIKVVDERYTLPSKKGGGIIKIEAWEDLSGNLIKYNIAYINHSIFQKDNGRVLGYDNAHGYHHKHFFGEITALDNFVSYEKLIELFENEIKDYIK